MFYCRKKGKDGVGTSHLLPGLHIQRRFLLGRGKSHLYLRWYRHGNSSLRSICFKPVSLTAWGYKHWIANPNLSRKQREKKKRFEEVCESTGPTELPIKWSSAGEDSKQHTSAPKHHAACHTPQWISCFPLFRSGGERGRDKSFNTLQTIRLLWQGPEALLQDIYIRIGINPLILSQL